MAVMADQVPYPYMTAKDMEEYLIEHLLYKFRRADKPELNFKIEAAYKKLFGVPMLPIEDSHAESICLHGTPGVGKTSAVRGAAKKVAKLLNMKLVSDPVPPYRPQPDDLLFSTLEMSGEVSAMIIGGIPIADQLGVQDPVKFMSKLPLYKLAIMAEATAGILLLDDFVNAAPSVQNSALSIALEGRFQMMDLGNTYVALTANLGALDNSDTVPLSDPMTARIGHYYVEDTVPDFVDRANHRFKDTLGDAGVSSFLLQDPGLFLLRTDDERRATVNGLRTPFPCPRSWDKLINDLRIYRHRVEGSGEKLESPSAIIRLAESFIGKQASKQFGSYIYAMMTGAEPVAKKMIQDNLFEEAIFTKSYKDGLAADEQNFGYQLAFCLANHASVAITNKGVEGMPEIMKRYCQILFKLDEPTIALSISEFGSRISRMNPDWSVKDKSGYPSHLDIEMTKAISSEIFKNGAGHVNADFAKIITHALLSADMREGYNSNITKQRKARGKSGAPSAP